MKVFLDANVLVSVVNREYPVYTFSSRVLSLPQPGFRLYASSLSLAITYYFASKKYGSTKAKNYIELLHKNIFITACGEKEVAEAISNKKINDFEDGMQYYAAVNSGCVCIVTEDEGDYYFSEIDVVNSRDFLLKNFSR